MTPTRSRPLARPVAWLSGTEAYYAFDIGRVHFICLDSHDLSRQANGEMALWLKADLEMVDADWLIAFWHHPPYTKGTHDSDRETQLIEMRELILPILESSGVDLVLAGHSHIYERSMLIDGAYATPTVADGVVLDDGDGNPDGNGAYRKSAALNPNEGTVAVVAGHGRSAASSWGVSPDHADDDRRGRISHHRHRRGHAHRQDDQCRRPGAGRIPTVKQGEVTPAIIENPWRPVGPEFRVVRREPGDDRVEIFPVPPRR